MFMAAITVHRRGGRADGGAEIFGVGYNPVGWGRFGFGRPHVETEGGGNFGGRVQHRGAEILGVGYNTRGRVRGAG